MSTRPAGSVELPQKSSPRVVPRKLKTPAGSDSDSVVSSPNPVSKMTKVVDRRSPRNLATEKKKPTKVSEFETQLSRLQDELKKAKDQLSSSESQKRKAELDAKESKKCLAAMSAKLEETHNQLNQLFESEDARLQELREISHDRDRAWQSELEAVQKQHSIESSALASAMNEIQKLKIQLERVSHSEASHARYAESADAELQCLRAELTETLDLVDKLKEQLNDSPENETQAHEEVIRAKMELEAVKTSEEKLQSELDDALKLYNSLVLELEESKNRVNSLEELVSKTSAVEVIQISSGNGEKCDEESENVKTEVNDLQNEVSRLRGELETAERSYRDEYIQSTLEIRNAYEMMERAKSESCQREADLEAKLNKSNVEIEELRTKWIENQENQPDEREIELDIELRTLERTLKDLKASLMEKESRIQSITEENEMLKSVIKNKEVERSKANDEALIKLSSLTDEAVKSSKKAERVAEQLDATQASSSEMEAELRRLKVQSDQWRKAAEAAAAMLSSVSNGKYVERTGSTDYHTIGRKLGSEHGDDTDDDLSPKKRNGNMLRKIGVLLKKGQK